MRAPNIITSCGYQHVASSRAFDLVVCQSVLQYLSNSLAEQHEHLAVATKRVMYFEVRHHRILNTSLIVDQPISMSTRVARSPRKRLTKHFTHAGAGLWLANTSGIAPYEFERSR